MRQRCWIASPRAHRSSGRFKSRQSHSRAYVLTTMSYSCLGINKKMLMMVSPRVWGTHFSSYMPLYHLNGLPFTNNAFSSVQSLSCVRLFVTPWSAAWKASLSITSSRSLLKLKSIESVVHSNHHILYHPLLFLTSIFPSIRVYSN